MTDKTRCLVCGLGVVSTILNCGDVPLSNRFPVSTAESCGTVSLSLGVCGECGLVQLGKTPSSDDIRSLVDWIFYTEPEGHLDDVVQVLLELPGITPDSVVGAITFKDDSTLERLKARGFSRVWRLDPQDDLGVVEPNAGLETIQDRLTPSAAQKIAARRGLVDVLIVRHILEHTYRPGEFIAALKTLLNPAGRIVFEVPDCERAMASRNFMMPWEEHTLYFTQGTFERALSFNGCSVEKSLVYPYSVENSLVAVVRVGSPAAPASANVVASERERAMAYGAAFPAMRQRWDQYLSALSEPNRRVALFGAGHTSVMFLSLFRAAKTIRFVLDDNPHKRNRYLSGTGLRIWPSSALMDENIQLCLLSTSPESAEKISAKNQTFLSKGGRFQSIFSEPSLS